jgi:hypothetical protein
MAEATDITDDTIVADDITVDTIVDDDITDNINSTKTLDDLLAEYPDVPVPTERIRTPKGNAPVTSITDDYIKMLQGGYSGHSDGYGGHGDGYSGGFDEDTIEIPRNDLSSAASRIKIEGTSYLDDYEEYNIHDEGFTHIHIPTVTRSMTSGGTYGGEYDGTYGGEYDGTYGGGTYGCDDDNVGLANELNELKDTIDELSLNVAEINSQQEVCVTYMMEIMKELRDIKKYLGVNGK